MCDLQPAADGIAHDDRAELLAEYAALRGEILSRIQMRQQILTLTVAVFGILVTLSQQRSTPELLLLAYPVLGAFLAAGWAHNDVRIGEIGTYIRTTVERSLPRMHWETELERKRSDRVFRPAELVAIGTIIGSQVFTVILTLPFMTYSCQELTYLVFDTFAIALTFFAIAWRTILRSRLARADQKSHLPPTS